MKILATGTAGLIGFHLAKGFTNEGHQITGADNINDYYDVNLKYARIGELGFHKGNIQYNKLIVSEKDPSYQFVRLHLKDASNINLLVKNQKFDYVYHPAAQAGVRYSLTNPHVDIDSNIF